MYDVIIIGGGPAGMSTALNLRRNSRSVLIIEKENFGGQISTSPRVENLPGIVSISGSEFSDNFFSQITELGTDFELEDVIEVKKVDNHFVVKTNYNTYECRALVAANGAKHRHMNLPKEDELNGISYCAVCDGAFYKNEDVFLIGDANTALQYALLLATYCRKVRMFALFDRLFGDVVLQQRVIRNPNIEVNYQMNLIEFEGTTDLTGLKFQNTVDKTIKSYKTKNVFIAIGQIPDNDKFSALADLEKGFILTNDRMETKTPGFYAVGDTRKKDTRQVVTAVGDGSVAAMFITRYLDSLEG